MRHSLGLGHVNEEGPSMYPTVIFLPSDNWSARDVITTAEEETATKHFVGLSRNFTFRACGIDPLLANDDCENVYGLKVDIAEVDNPSELVIYPNPTFGGTNMLSNIDQIGTSYVVYSGIGTEMLRERITGIETELTLQSLAKGVYYIRVGNNPQQSFRVIKQ